MSVMTGHNPLKNRPCVLVCAAFCACLFTPVFAAAPAHAKVSAASSHSDSPARAASADTATADSLAAKKKKKNDLQDTVVYRADVIDYDMKNKILYLFGKAIIEYQNIVLTADSITYSIDNNRFIAYGKPQLVEGSDTTVGESMAYNIKTRRGSVVYASTHMQDASFNANTIVKAADNTFYSSNGDYTTCENIDDPHYYFYARDVKVLPNDKIIARPAVFNIAEVPVGALPYFILPLQRNRSSGILTPAFGGNPASGGYLDNVGYYWAINDYIDATVSSRIQEFQNFLVSASSRYNLRYVLSGDLSARYSLGGDFGRQSQQWALNYHHDQNLTPDGLFRLSGGGSLVSNRNFYNLHSESTSEKLQQMTDANLTLNKTFSSINAGTSATWQRHENLASGTVSEDIPSLSFGLPSRPLIPEKPPEAGAVQPSVPEEPAWYHKIYYSYNVHGIRRHIKQPDAIVEPEYTHAGAEQSAGLSYNYKLFKWFDISPHLNGRMYALDAYKDTTPIDTVFRFDTLYDTVNAVYLTQAQRADTQIVDTIFYTDSLGQTDTSFRVVSKVNRDSAPEFKTTNEWNYGAIWDAGVAMSTRLYGLFPIHFLNFAGMRHTLSPSVNFTYTPKSTAPGRRYYDIGVSPYTARKQSRTVNFGLGNSFEGKTVKKPAGENDKPTENKFHMLSLDFGASYDFDDLNNDGRKWSDLNASASTSNKLIGISVGSAWWLYNTRNELTAPILRSYNVGFNPQINFSAGGTLWSGDLQANVWTGSDPRRQREALPGAQQTWTASLRPSYGFSGSRSAPGEPFVTQKNYSLSASAGVNFTKIWSASWDSYYNFVTNQLVGHSFNFHCDLECFDLRFNWRPSGFNTGYYFLIQIKKIPEFKWEKKPD